jgi:hypothetical protein
MPNYVFSILLIEGSLSERTLLCLEEFNFELSVPDNTIKEVISELGKYKCDIPNNAIEVDIKNISCITEVRFLTKWERPIKWFESVCLKYSKIKMKLISRIESNNIVITEYYKNNNNETIYEETHEDYGYIHNTYFENCELISSAPHLKFARSY